MNHNYLKELTKHIILFLFITNISYAQGYISETIQHDGLIREYMFLQAMMELQVFLYYLIYMEAVVLLLFILAFQI